MGQNLVTKHLGTDILKEDSLGDIFCCWPQIDRTMSKNYSHEIEWSEKYFQDSAKSPFNDRNIFMLRSERIDLRKLGTKGQV